MTARFVPSILALVLLAGACSSSDDAASASTTTSTSAPDTSASSPPTATSEPDPTSGPDSSSVPSPTDTTPATGTAAPSSTTTVTTTVTTSVTTTGGGDGEGGDQEFTASEAADRDAARTALISLALFPDGWVEDPVEDEDDDATAEAFEAEFDACLGRDADEQVGDRLDRLKVRTGDFHPADDDTTTVSHEVVLAADVETALDAMAEVRVDGAERCLADVIGDFYEATFADDPDLADVGIGEVLVTRTETARDPEVTAGVLLEIPLTIGDQTVSQFLELLYQRQGRALSELSFSSFGAQFSRDGFTVLSDEVSVRLAAIDS